MTQPTVSALKDDGLSTMSRANPTRLSSLKGKEKNVRKKKFSIYTAPRRPKTQRCLEDRELNQARSKPDTVNRPVRTARIFVHHYNSTHYCNTETVFIYIRLPPDQHHISDVANKIINITDPVSRTDSTIAL